jgi:hypothetical protein
MKNRILPEIDIPLPKINQVQCTREELPLRYAELLNRNPLLGRIEGSAKAIAWTDLEIRTYQLLTAVASNASLQQRLIELETALGRKL